MTLLDLVLSPFGADTSALVDAAQRAEDEGYDGVWIFDHISSLASLSSPGRGVSRDPFAVLGAIAARTTRIRLGVLVANIANRHPAQLALAVDTLLDLAPGRVVCGVGAGAGPGSPFAREDIALRRPVLPAARRRDRLGEYLLALRAIWNGQDASGEFTTVGLTGVIANPAPPLIVGGASPATLALGAQLADGVNIASGFTRDLDAQVRAVRTEYAGRATVAKSHPSDHGDCDRGAQASSPPFEIGVFTASSPTSDDHAMAHELEIDRITCLTVG